MKATSTPKKSPAEKEAKENSFPVVAIGASAGGLEAMMEFLKYLPADTGMAFIYVQHLSPDHKSLLTEILSKKTKMLVQEIDDMDKIQPNNVFVIPYNKGIEVTDGHIKLTPRSESGAAITIDILFSTLAEAQKERVIGIVLSGSASDGTIGIKAIKHEGGLTFAQDDTAKFTSMPHSAIAAGAVDFILSPKEMALELDRLSKHPLIKTIGVKNGEEDLIENSDPDLKTILNQLHKVTGVDFSAYKMNTIKRRIIRRMLLYKITILKEYAKLLSQKKEEIDILYQDLLINVTSFFRDTDTHNYLKESLFPKLLKRKKPGESFRIWVPACASGEESYSIAMMLLEIQESKTPGIPIQIFATDLSEQAIRKARIGLYSKQDLEAVSPKRIQRFFTKADGGFRVNKAVREMCVFAPHNILRDPPFSRLDFISCCNLFIYFDNSAQKKAVNTFHYALNEDGFLMLGKSENISHSANLFTSFNKKYKIFSRKITSGSRTLPAVLPRYAPQIYIENGNLELPKSKTKKNIAVNHNGLDNAIDALLITEFMPASVVINYQMEIVQFRGNTDLFLTHPKGKATFNILKMARPEIAFELRNTISKIIKTKNRIRKGGIELKINEKVKIVSIEIVPLQIELDEPLILILFSEQEQIEGISLNSASAGRGSSLAKDHRIKKLEIELAEAQADALAIAQEQEAFTEELQSANEEVVSSNEELQTVNEELETSKEEIESANEELTTTNQELQTRNDLLNEAYNFSEALFATLHEPMIVLDKNLRVKSANKTFYKTFKVNEEETEGVLLYDLGNKQWNIPSLRELLENILPKNTHFHDFEIIHTFPLIGEKIMLLNASRIVQKTNNEELILLAIIDITEVRKKVLELQSKEKEILLLQINSEQGLRKKIEDSEKRYNMMFMQSPFAFAILKGKDMVVALANNSVKQLWGKGNKIEGKPLVEILPEIKNQEFPALLQKVYTTGIPYIANEALARVKRKGKMENVYFNFVYQPYREVDDTISGVTIIAVEVTEQVKAKKIIEENDKRFRNLVEQAPVAMCVVRGDKFVFEVANEKHLQLIGKTKEQVMNMPVFTALPEAAGQGYEALLGGVYKTGIPFIANESPLTVNRNGKEETIYVNFVFEPLYDMKHKIDGVFSIASDVTEQVLAKKIIEESEKQLQNIFKQSPFAFSIMKGEDMVITNANNLMKDFWGKGNDLEGKTLLEVLPELKDQPFPEMLGSVYTTGIPISANEILASLNRHGIVEEHYFNLTYQPYFETAGIISGVITIAHEVSEQVIARKKIEDSESLFRIALFLTAKTVFKQDNQLRYTWIYNTHPSFETKELIGKTDRDLFNNDAAEILTTIKKEVLKTGNTFTGDIQIQIDGKQLIFAMRVEATKDIGGKIDGIIAMSDDITETKRAENNIIESEKKFKQLAELMPQKVWTADAKGNKTYFNQTFLDYTGLTYEEIKNGGWIKIIHPDDFEENEKRWQQSIATGNNFENESRFLRKDGKFLWHLTLAVALKDEQDKVILWIGSKTEIEEQRKQKELLEDAVSNRTAELKQSNQELIKINKELEAFTYVSSHDLQEPIRKIQTFAGRILEKENQNLSDKGKNYFRLLQDEAQRMKSLIQDLLAFSQLNIADRKFEITDLNIIVKEVINEFAEAIAEKNAVIEVKKNCKVYIISFQFRQLMHNLISNALKFSNPKTPPHITIESRNIKYNKLNVPNLPPQKEYCHISITDNGIGFEKEFAEKIFEVFQRLHGKEEYKGTGIGLAIVKKIVENHSGIISATSELNKGTTFNVYIPA